MFARTREDKSGRTDGTWSRVDLDWDSESNHDIWPDEEALKLFRCISCSQNRGLDGKGVATYQAPELRCQVWPSTSKSCPNADARQITRDEYEDARDIAQADQSVASLRLRKKVETLFAQHRPIWSLGRPPLRRPTRAQDEFLLVAIVKNLRNLTKIFPALQKPRRA